MVNIYTYYVDFPPGVREAVLPCADGYTVYIDEKLDRRHRIDAFVHALKHISRHDWEKDDVEEIEREILER